MANRALVLKVSLASDTCLLIFYWPKQVIWPHLTSNRPKGEGHGGVVYKEDNLNMYPERTEYVCTALMTYHTTPLTEPQS